MSVQSSRGSDRRPFVAVFTRSFFPSAVGAGPSRSLAALADRLSDEFRFRIVTTDRHTRNDSPLEGIVSNEWTTAPETDAPVRYCAPEEWGFLGWMRVLRSIAPDLYYFNSMFALMTVRTLLLRRFRLIPAAPMIVAPRGEFAPDALGLKNRKKSFYLRMVSLLNLLDGVVLQASTERERKDIVAALPDRSAQVVVAMDMMRAPSASATVAPAARKVPGELRLVLVGRVARMKNVHYAIEALGGIAGTIRLDVIGPPEDAAYVDECVETARRLPPNVTVTFAGEVAPGRVAALLPSYDAFFLPTLGENYCHAIVEALGAGLPVIISDRTPWSGVRDTQAGWVFGLENDEEVRSCLTAALAMSETDFAPLRRAARAFAADIAQSDRAEIENRVMLRKALGVQHVSTDPSKEAAR